MYTFVQSDGCKTLLPPAMAAALLLLLRPVLVDVVVNVANSQKSG